MLVKLLSLFISLSILAQAPIPMHSFDYTRQMYTRVEEISKLSPSDFEIKINSIRGDIDRYIEHKKGVCQGDFSTVILGVGATPITQPTGEFKLSKTEQELCYRELKALQMTYINNLYIARKSFLNHLHEQRIKELGFVREEALKQLHSTFDKKIPSKGPARVSE